MPNLNGNIPDHVFYGSLMAEILRIGRATLLYEDFLPRVQQLFERMAKQGGLRKKMSAQITKVMRNHPEPFNKFDKSNLEIISNIKV